MKLEFCRQSFEKFSNIKLHENPFIESRVVSRERRDGRTNMTKLIITFHNYANAPNKTEWLVTVEGKLKCKQHLMEKLVHTYNCDLFLIVLGIT